jgi:glyoxylase-like metal-dependent hydrolase (beta-lactamase superfamily II)
VVAGGSTGRLGISWHVVSGLPILGSTAEWNGGGCGERAVCVLAPNPSPMTLDGTNTWILSEPGSHECLVVDPGPDDDAHLDAVLATLAQRDLTVAMTVLTHGHLDHSESARRWHDLTGAPVRAVDPQHRYGGEGVGDGEVLAIDGLEVRVVGTPGHSGDSVCLVVPAEGFILTGDTVLGRGTTVVAWPDGDLAAYLDSLERLRIVCESATILLPGHGPVLTEPATVVGDYLIHRRARLEQVRAAMVSGAQTAEAVVDAVYADIPDDVRPAAIMSAQAQVTYINAGG